MPRRKIFCLCVNPNRWYIYVKRVSFDWIHILPFSALSCIQECATSLIERRQCFVVFRCHLKNKVLTQQWFIHPLIKDGKWTAAATVSCLQPMLQAMHPRLMRVSTLVSCKLSILSISDQNFDSFVILNSYLPGMCWVMKPWDEWERQTSWYRAWKAWE